MKHKLAGSVVFHRRYPLYLRLGCLVVGLFLVAVPIIICFLAVHQGEVGGLWGGCKLALIGGAFGVMGLAFLNFFRVRWEEVSVNESGQIVLKNSIKERIVDVAPDNYLRLNRRKISFDLELGFRNSWRTPYTLIFGLDFDEGTSIASKLAASLAERGKKCPIAESV